MDQPLLFYVIGIPVAIGAAVATAFIVLLACRKSRR